MFTLFRTVIAVCVMAVGTAVAADAPAVTIHYPVDRSVVGNKVNFVLDFATDWSAVPFFQVLAGKREYPVVETSSGRHAMQGIALEPGVNTLTLRLFAYKDAARKKGMELVSTREITIYSDVPVFSGNAIPEGFTVRPFHTRGQEKDCSGCHRMDVEPADLKPVQPADMICYTCHKSIPTGKHIHGPAAVWGCISCHDPDEGPVKYRFADRSPWKITRTTQPVEPLVFTIPSDGVFNSSSSSLAIRRKQLKDLLAEPLSALRRHRAYSMFLEVHTDGAPIRNPRYKDHRQLAKSRARVLSTLLVQFGVSKAKISVVGVGRSSPRAGEQGSGDSNRIVIVLHPAGTEVKSSEKLPSMKGWERQVVQITYANGPAVSGLTVREALPSHVQYVRDTGTVQGRFRNPRINKSALIWNLGGRKGNFEETIAYVVRRTGTSSKAPPETAISYTQQDGVIVHYAPFEKGKKRRTVAETCLSCHQGMLDGAFRHGPTEAGYCNLCHDPHASPNPAWLRKPAWDLCVTCHAEMAEGKHVVAGFVSGKTHPTKGRSDPARPGRELSCASCHNAHSGKSRSLFVYGVKERHDLCVQCHKNF